MVQPSAFAFACAPRVIAYRGEHQRREVHGVGSADDDPEGDRPHREHSVLQAGARRDRMLSAAPNVACTTAACSLARSRHRPPTELRFSRSRVRAVRTRHGPSVGDGRPLHGIDRSANQVHDGSATPRPWSGSASACNRFTRSSRSVTCSCSCRTTNDPTQHRPRPRRRPAAARHWRPRRGQIASKRPGSGRREARAAPPSSDT